MAAQSSGGASRGDSSGLRLVALVVTAAGVAAALVTVLGVGDSPVGVQKGTESASALLSWLLVGAAALAGALAPDLGVPHERGGACAVLPLGRAHRHLTRRSALFGYDGNATHVLGMVALVALLGAPLVVLGKPGYAALAAAAICCALHLALDAYALGSHPVSWTLGMGEGGVGGTIKTLLGGTPPAEGGSKGKSNKRSWRKKNSAPDVPDDESDSQAAEDTADKDGG